MGLKACCGRLLLFCIFITSLNVYAADLGFRYKNGKCLNDKGVEGLNTSYFGQCADFRNTILGQVNLNGIDLSGSRFTTADLQGTTFENAILAGVDFDSANLASANFVEAEISSASFRSANLRNANFADARIQKSDFSGANFSQTTLSYVQFQASTLNKANFAGATLDSAGFVSCSLEDARFSSALLQGADFAGSSLNRANFSGANLTGAKLENLPGEKVNFERAILSQASLRGSSFNGANCSNARLVDVNLERVKLQMANLKGADLSRTMVERAEFRGAVFSKHTQLPFTKDKALALGMELAYHPVLVLWHKKSAELEELFKTLQGLTDVKYSTMPESSFSSPEELKDIEMVLHFTDGSDSDVPDAGQVALVKFVEQGGVYFNDRGSVFRYDNGKSKKLGDLLALRSVDRDYEYGTRSIKRVMDHPVLLNVNNFYLNGGFGLCKLFEFGSQPARVLLADSKGRPALAAREFGKGKVLTAAFHMDFDSDAIANPEFAKIIMNTLEW